MHDVCCTVLYCAGTRFHAPPTTSRRTSQPLIFETLLNYDGGRLRRQLVTSYRRIRRRCCSVAPAMTTTILVMHNSFVDE